MDNVIWVVWTILAVVMAIISVGLIAFIVLSPFVFIYKILRTATIAGMNKFQLGSRDTFSGTVVDKRIEQNGDSDRTYIVVLRCNEQGVNRPVECGSKAYDSCLLGDDVSVTIGNGVLLSFSRVEIR